MRYFIAPATLGLAPSDGYGAERIPPEGGAMLAANHFSGLDHPLICCFCPRPVYYMAKAELFDVPVFGELLHWTGTFPIRRGEADRDAPPGGPPHRPRGRHDRRPHRGHAAEVRAPGADPARGPVGRDHGGRPGAPGRARHVRVDAVEPEAVRGRLRRADLRSTASRAAGPATSRRARSWARRSCGCGRLAVGAVRDGFPPELPDGAQRNDVVRPGWRPTRAPR